MFRSRFVSAAAFLAFAVLLLAFLSRAPEEAITGAAHAIDGDSVVVNGEEMRIKGIDAPEYRQTCQADGQNLPCGQRATAAMKRWLTRGPVYCYGAERDRYNRRLVLCRVNGVDIGRDLVINGLAVDYGLYPEEEREAAAAKRGIWATTFERPEEYRRRMRETGEPRGRPLSNTGASPARATPPRP
jgi:endonuclease YncB( thermonuclease family)